MTVKEMVQALYDKEIGEDSGSTIYSLGTIGNTFDLSSYEGYENFTTDNFFVQITSITSSAGTATINEWTDSYSREATMSTAQITGGSATHSSLLSYNASTGVLTTTKSKSGSVTLKGTSCQDSYDTKSASATLSISVTGNVYLIL